MSEHISSLASTATTDPEAAPAVRRARRAFTLLELIVVVAIVGILAAIALPNFLQSPIRAKEAVLKTNLHTMRSVLDQYYGDKGVYPPTLEALVEDGYLRDVPYDPMSQSFEWGLVYDQDTSFEDDFLDDDLAGAAPGIIDVYSLSEGSSLDGEPYADW